VRVLTTSLRALPFSVHWSLAVIVNPGLAGSNAVDEVRRIPVCFPAIAAH
jgi:hypothetical protein